MIIDNIHSRVWVRLQTLDLSEVTQPDYPMATQPETSERSHVCSQIISLYNRPRRGRTLAILFISCFFPFLTFAQSSETHYPTKTAIQILEQPFQTERVSENDLRQFEAKALQKIQDFDDYMKLAADKMYDKEMREYSVELALAPFQTDSAAFFIQQKKINISKLLRTSLNENELQYTFRKCTLSKNFNRLPGEIKYTGKIKGELVFLSNSSWLPFEMSIYLIKTPKAFGKETREVWEVFLGDIICE